MQEMEQRERRSAASLLLCCGGVDLNLLPAQVPHSAASDGENEGEFKPRCFAETPLFSPGDGQTVRKLDEKKKNDSCHFLSPFFH